MFVETFPVHGPRPGEVGPHRRRPRLSAFKGNLSRGLTHGSLHYRDRDLSMMVIYGLSRIFFISLPQHDVLARVRTAPPHQSQ